MEVFYCQLHVKRTVICRNIMNYHVVITAYGCVVMSRVYVDSTTKYVTL